MKTFNRRVMLRGLGGAAVAAPFLPSVAEREAKAQGMTATAPKRLIVFYTHYGCLTTRWFPKLSHGALTTADYMAMNTLKPMAPYANKLLMVRGLRSMNEWSNEGSNGQKNDPHTQVQGSFFTCHPVTPNADSGFDTSDPSGVSPKTAAKPTGRSLDHVCAEQVNAGGAAPLFMEIGGVSGTTSNTMHILSWDQPMRPFPGVTSPTALYNTLTGLFGGNPSTPNADTYRVAKGKSIIDCVRDDLNRYKAIRMSSADLKRVNDWTELLHYATPGDDRLGGRAVHDGHGHQPDQAQPDEHPAHGGVGHRHEDRHRQDREGLHGSLGVDGDVRQQPRHLPEDARELRLQEPGPHPRVALRVPPDRQRQPGRRVRQQRARDGSHHRQVLRGAVCLLRRPPRRLQRGRRQDGARQHRHRLVPGDVGWQQPQPQQHADSPGWELRRLLQDGVGRQRRGRDGRHEPG